MKSPGASKGDQVHVRSILDCSDALALADQLQKYMRVVYKGKAAMHFCDVFETNQTFYEKTSALLNAPRDSHYDDFLEKAKEALESTALEIPEATQAVADLVVIEACCKPLRKEQTRGTILQNAKTLLDTRKWVASPKVSILQDTALRS